MSLNWPKISVAAEIISSVAIVITLIYLSIQTQQNTEALLANTRNQIIDSDTAITQSLIEDPSIELSFYQDDPLNDIERVKLENWLIALVRTREYQWLQYKNNLLDQQTWDAFLSAIAVTLSFPRTRAWWDAVSIEYFDDDFVKEINNYLKNYPVVENYKSPIEGI